jgi:transketolase
MGVRVKRQAAGVKRKLSIGVPRTEHRKYGSAAQHDAAFGLDAAGLQRRIEVWVEGRE